ncbi:hypothetical protein SRHO_G00014490 [Serrasalmus rhombeus]
MDTGRSIQHEISSLKGKLLFLLLLGVLEGLVAFKGERSIPEWHIPAAQAEEVGGKSRVLETKTPFQLNGVNSDMQLNV